MKKVLFVVKLVSVFALFVSCSGGEKLYIFNWTYYTPPSVLEKFSAEYGIEIVEDNFDSNESMYNKIRAGGADFDIVFPSCDYVKIMIAQDMLHEIDKSKLQNLENIDPLVLSQADYDPEMRYSVPYYWGAAGLAVNKAALKKVQLFDFERSWSLLASPELEGRVTMLDDPREVLGDALKFLGFSVNTLNPQELSAAHDLIKTKWRKNIHRFDAEAFAKNYATGSFWVVQGYPEGFFQETIDKEELLKDTEFFIPNEGGPSYIDSMCILNGAKNIDAAHKFIDFIHRPEIYAEFCDTFRFPSAVNIPARQFIKNKPWYNAEDLERTEIKRDLGDALEMYMSAWQDLR